MNYKYINEIFLTEVFSASPKTIADAVLNKRVISIYYKGGEEDTAGWRNIEPACYGRDFKGRQVLRAFQHQGKTTTSIPKWKFFLIDRIKNWNVSSNKNFSKRPLFNERGDKHMAAVYTISDFNDIKTSPLPKTLQTQGSKNLQQQKNKNVVKRLKTLEEIYDIL